MSSAAYLDYEDPIVLADWLAFCSEHDIVFSPNTVGQNVFYQGDVEVKFGNEEGTVDKEPGGRILWDTALPPEKATHITVSTFFMGNVAGVAELAKEVWREWQGASVSADPEVRESWWRGSRIQRSFTVWPTEGTWEQPVYELFRQYGRVVMDFDSDEAFVTFSDSLTRSGLTLREIE